MSVVLLILKIIGITLLCILGLVFLILTVVLWVPIRYGGNVVYLERIDLHAFVTWLLKILRIQFDWVGGETELSVKIFGKRLSIGGSKTEETEEAPESPAAENAQPETPDTEAPADTEVPADAEVQAETPEEANVPVSETEQSPETAETVTAAETEAQESTSTDESTGSGKTMLDKLKHLFIETDRGQRALKHVLKYVGKILASVLPNKGSGYIRYGFDSPALTGQVLGAYSAAVPPRKRAVEIRPVFTEPCFECDMTIEGRIIPGWLALLAIVLVLNKDVLYVIRQLRSK